MKIGIAGLGRMGRAFVHRLTSQGHDLIAWNRSASDPAPKVAMAATPAALAAQADFIITSLTNDKALKDVYLGADGLLAGAVAGKVFAETSTVKPATQRGLAAKATAAGAGYLDAPVLGTVNPAREGKLIMMVGGDAATLARARPVLEQLARVIHHVGPNGAGAAMKLAVNIPLGLYWAALGDSVALAEACGLNRNQLFDILHDSPAALNQFGIKLPVLRGEKAEVGFDIAGVVKDLTLINETAADAGLTLPMASHSKRMFEEATRAGAGTQDVASIVLVSAALRAKERKRPQRE
jgi:3-hydroxyisobutyrate dehydrogenase